VDELPIIDRARLDAITRGDNVLAAEFLHDLIAEGEAVLARLSTSVASNDRSAVTELAHSLKGMSTEIGAVRLRAVAAALEAETRPECWGAHVDGVRAAIDELRTVSVA
jgi:HPt (histidine-containing phosphotransfer) domain-containing protein